MRPALELSLGIACSGLVAGVLAGCGATPTLRSGGPHLAPGPEEGIRYYVARDLIVVEGTVRKRTRTDWKQISGSATCDSVDTVALPDSVAFTIATEVVPDRRWSFRLALQPSKTVDQSLNVAVTEVGILTGINYEAKDRTGEIVSGFVKGIAGIAGSVLGAKTVEKSQWNTLAMLTKLHTPSAQECLLRSPEGAGFSQIPTLEAGLDSLLEGRRANALLALRAKSATEVASLRRRDALLVRSAEVLEERLARLEELLEIAASAYARSKGVGEHLGPPTAFHQTFDVGDLPAIDTAHFGQATNSADPRLDLYKLAGVVLTVSELPSGARGTPASIDTNTTPLGCPGKASTDKCARLHYRIPHQRLLRVFQRAKATDTLRLTDETLLSLVASYDPIYEVAISTERFGSTGLKAQFGRYGNLISVEQRKSAAMANGTTAIVDAIAAGRTEFLAGLKTVAEAQGSVMDLRQAARTARIKEIEDQKALLEAKIATQGARASEALLLSKQQLDAELGLLTSQQALEAKQASSALTGIQAELASLKLQLDLLKAKMELENARKAATDSGSSRVP